VGAADAGLGINRASSALGLAVSPSTGFKSSWQAKEI
jgi:hypothetical protein